MGRRLGLLWFVALALLVAGCASGADVEIVDWELVVEGGPVPSAVHLPAHFAEAMPKRDGHYELRTTVALPNEWRGRPLTLAMPLFYGRASLTANGGGADALDAADDASYRGIGPQRWRIPAARTQGDTLALVLSVEHRWTQSAWIDAPPRLSDRPEGDAASRVRRVVYVAGSWAAVGSLSTLAFTFFAIWVLDRTRFADGWFALGSIASLAFPLFNLGILPRLFGRFDVPLMGILLPVAAFAALRFARHELNLRSEPRIITALPVLVIAVAVVAHGPFAATRILAPAVLFAVASIVIYQCLCLARLALGPSPPVNTWTITGCWFFLAAAIANDAIAWLGFGDPLRGTRTSGVGLTAFALLQAIALSRRHNRSVALAEALNAQLAERVTLLETRQIEIEQLNHELRRQVGERSRDLAGAMRGTGRANVDRLGPGRIVADRYEVTKHIDRGGMGSVFEVVRIADGRRLAMKVMSTADASAVRFAREAQLIAQVDHPNVVSIVDIDVASEGFLFLVMELADGVTLNACDRRFGELPWAYLVLAQLARALVAIHQRGIVHRDIKPANVIVGGDYPRSLVVKLTDFGISKHDGAEDVREDCVRDGATRDGDVVTANVARYAPTALTNPGALIGTPMFMAPELMGGSLAATSASDVFAFGALAYEVLSRVRPFRQSPALAAGRGEYVPPAPLGGAVAAPVAELVGHCLAQVPRDRPTAPALLEVLEAITVPEATGTA